MGKRSESQGNQDKRKVHIGLVRVSGGKEEGMWQTKCGRIAPPAYMVRMFEDDGRKAGIDASQITCMKCNPEEQAKIARIRNASSQNPPRQLEIEQVLPAVNAAPGAPAPTLTPAPSITSECRRVSTVEEEMGAMKQIVVAMEGLDDAARSRVYSYVYSRFFSYANGNGHG